MNKYREKERKKLSKWDSNKFILFVVIYALCLWTCFIMIYFKGIYTWFD